MTADPVNIKAILATQFADFGKGEEFHDGWKFVLSRSPAGLIFTVVSRGWNL